VIGNMMEGKTTGIEAWGSLHVNSGWRLSAGAVFLDQDLKPKAGSGDANIAAAGNDPQRQLMLRSSFDLSDAQDLDIMVRHVGALPSPAVPRYTALDARYAWRLQHNLELSVTAQNLLDPRHPEFNSPAARSEIERALFLRLRWSQ
jgi:iron complex outermembrane receptor protein